MPGAGCDDRTRRAARAAASAGSLVRALRPGCAGRATRSDLELLEHVGGAADVVPLRMGEDERRQPSTPSLSSCPATSRLGRPLVDENRALRNLQQDRVALADVEHGDPQARPASGGGRFRRRDAPGDGESDHGGERRGRDARRSGRTLGRAGRRDARRQRAGRHADQRAHLRMRKARRRAARRRRGTRPASRRPRRERCAAVGQQRVERSGREREARAAARRPAPRARWRRTSRRGPRRSEARGSGAVTSPHAAEMRDHRRRAAPGADSPRAVG